MSEEARGLSPWNIVGGMVLFGIIDFGMFMAFVDQGDGIGWIVALAVTGLLGGLLLAFGRHSFAYGVFAGYVVMTIVSGGVCTITFADPLDEGAGAFTGLILYPIIVVGMIIIAIVAGRTGRDE